MSNVEYYAFLGMVNSGKTVYYTVMFRELQDALNATADSRLEYTPEIGKKINDFYKALRNHEWPEKTKVSDKRGEITLNSKKSKYNMVIRDYPGEVLDALAFDALLNTNSVNPELKDLKDLLNNEKLRGIFIIVDMEAVFNDDESSEVDQTLSILFRTVREKKKVKIAFIPSKLEKFDEKFIEENKNKFKSKFSKTYPNAYASLYQIKHEFFSETMSLGKLRKRDDGIDIPDDICPVKLFEPIFWLFDLEPQYDQKNKLIALRKRKKRSLLDYIFVWRLFS